MLNMMILHLLYLVLGFAALGWLIPRTPYVVMAVAILRWLINQGTGSQIVTLVPQAQTTFLDLPIEVRTMIYLFFIPDIDVIYLANRRQPFNDIPAYWWRNLNRIVASHPLVRHEILDEFYRLRTVHILSGELMARCLYRRLIHLRHVVNLHFTLGSMSELHSLNGRPIAYPLLCHRCRQLRNLTLYVHVIDQALFNAIAGAACAQLTSITGLRDVTLRPRLIIFIRVEPVPRRPSEHNVRGLVAAFRYARAQYQFRSIQVPMHLRTIEIHLTLTARERATLEQQSFHEPGGSLWRFVTRAGQQMNEFRLTWTDGRSEDETEELFDRSL